MTRHLMTALVLLTSCTEQSSISFPTQGCTDTSCSGHGTCAESEGVAVCTCDVGYSGNDCSTAAPPKFEGSSSGVIPEYAQTADAGLLDAGMVVVDTTCCVTRFRISDEEPADAVGVLTGEAQVFRARVPLVRSDAGWTTSACVPVRISSGYWYEFTWDGGSLDAGDGAYDDGGFGPIILPNVERRVRASGFEPSVATALGQRNFYSPLDSCVGHDGGVP